MNACCIHPPRERSSARSLRGFSLIELMIAVVVIGVLITLSYPSFERYLIRVSREAAQTTLLQLAGLQEKIFLNSSAYAVASDSVTAAYTGTSSGGLGWGSGKTPDGKYTISIDSGGTATTFTLRAAPVAGTIQARDGDITINQAGTRLWANKPW
jgi:type IV pilus assembly protein PilE